MLRELDPYRGIHIDVDGLSVSAGDASRWTT